MLLTNVSIGRGSFTPVPTSMRRSSIGAVDSLTSPDTLFQKIIDNKNYEDEKKELIRWRKYSFKYIIKKASLCIHRNDTTDCLSSYAIYLDVRPVAEDRTSNVSDGDVRVRALPVARETFCN
jgi:hypothetical protein